MNRLTSFLIAGIAILSGSFVAVSAQASIPFVSLTKGQTKYVEMSLEPGLYVVYIDNGLSEDNAKASFSIYETNGKLIKQSSQLPSALQIAHHDQGAAFEIPRAKVVHFWIHMDACKTICEAGLVTVKDSSGTIKLIKPPFKILSARPSYSLSQSPQPTVTSKPGQSEVLVDNPHPSKCNFIRDGKLRDQCSFFKIDEDDSNFSLYFGFKDSGVVIAYVMPIKAIRTVERNGKTFRTYPVTARLLTVRGQKTQIFKNDEGTCAIATDYSELACGSPEFLYIYTQ